MEEAAMAAAAGEEAKAIRAAPEAATRAAPEGVRVSSHVSAGERIF